MSSSPTLLLVVAVLCVHSNLLLLPVHATSQDEVVTQDELESIYRSLPEQDRQVVDSWSVEEKEKYLRTRARFAREYSSGEPKPAVRDYSSADETPSLYKVDPLLRETFTKYYDTKVPREEVLALFSKYLEKTPDSVFLPEVYFRMGALYSMHRRPELGEKYGHQKMMEYFHKAHAIYGTKYSYLHVTLWGSLANMPESDLAFRKDYLRWLQGMSALDINDVWPVSEIEQTFNGRPPELDRAEREIILRNLQKDKDHYFESASENIFRIERGNPRSRADLAKSFPGTKLARQCALVADAESQFYLSAFDADAGSGSGDPAAGGQGAIRDPNAKTDPNSAPRSILLSEKGNESSRTRILAWGVGLIALVAVFLYVARRRASPRPGGGTANCL